MIHWDFHGSHSTSGETVRTVDMRRTALPAPPLLPIPSSPVRRPPSSSSVHCIPLLITCIPKSRLLHAREREADVTSSTSASGVERGGGGGDYQTKMAAIFYYGARRRNYTLLRCGEDEGNDNNIVIRQNTRAKDPITQYTLHVVLYYAMPLVFDQKRVSISRSIEQIEKESECGREEKEAKGGTEQKWGTLHH